MRTRQQWSVATIAWGLAATAVAAAAQPPADAGAATFSADVVVETSIVDSQGAVVEKRPKTQYRMSIRMANGVRQTEIVYAVSKLFPRGPLMDPRGGYRLVFDEGVPAPRVYDPTGALVAGSDAADSTTPGVPGTSTGPGFVFDDVDLRARKQDLHKRLGRSTGTVAGRDRYVDVQDAMTTETLVEPGTQLPVEINVVREGALEQRSLFSYARMPRGRWYLAAVREEAGLPGQGGRRLVTEKTFVNVVAAEGR
jgi:hypothetical protein